MQKKVQLSQQTAEWLITEHQLLRALLTWDDNTALMLQGKLAHYSGQQLDQMWSELYDEFQKVKGKEVSGKIQTHRTGMVRDGR